MATRDEVIVLMQEDEFSGLGELVALGEEAVPILIALRDDTGTPRYLQLRALVALGEIGSRAAEADIRSALAASDPVERILAIQALAKVAGADASDVLVMMLNDPDPSVTKAAMQNLSEVGNAQALVALERQKSESPHDFLRTQAEATVNDIQERVG